MATDDELGMAWWNALPEGDRRKWALRVGTGRAKDAWEMFKSCGATEGQGFHGTASLRDAHAALRQAIAELKALGVAVPISLYQAAHALAYAERGECQVLPFKQREQEQ